MKNVGIIDRNIRYAAALLALAGGMAYSGTARVVLLGLAALLGVTAAIGFCPLWSVLRIDTRGKS